MKLTAGNSAEFLRYIDDAFPADAAMVRRYRNALKLYDDPALDRLFKDHLLHTGIREGARIVELLTYRDVTVHVADETSGMTTGSLKAIDGCLTAALCVTEGITRIAVESGGNTGSALTRYARQAGVESFFFCPLGNLDLLDSRLFVDREAHLIGVEEPGQVKEFTRLFAEITGIRHLPEKSWRYAASMFRGLFLLEEMLRGRSYDWIAQTVSAGFGPIGIYNVLDAFSSEIPAVPRFLGVQQESNCPMYKVWKNGVPGEPAERGNLLTRVMYDDTPQTYRTQDDFRQLLTLSGGDMVTVNGEEFHSYMNVATGEPLVCLLRSRGIDISMKGDEIMEKTGMIGLAGTLKAIDEGIIPPGCRVLCCVTGGATGADGNARPETILRSREDVVTYAGNFDTPLMGVHRNSRHS